MREKEFIKKFSSYGVYKGFYKGFSSYGFLQRVSSFRVMGFTKGFYFSFYKGFLVFVFEIWVLQRVSSFRFRVMGLSFFDIKFLLLHQYLTIIYTFASIARTPTPH